jgi:hypothetical protein
MEARSTAKAGTGSTAWRFSTAAPAATTAPAEATAAPSMLLDWRALKQAAISTARAALESTDAILPSLRDAGTVARINTGRAEIEAKLKGSTLTEEK